MGMIPLRLRQDYMGLRAEAKLCKITVNQLREKIRQEIIKADLTLRDRNGKPTVYLFRKVKP